MKIAYATDQYWPCVSGVSVSIDSFRRELESLGHEVHILAPCYGEDDSMDATRHDPGRIHRFRSKKVFFNDENRLVLRSESKAVRLLPSRNDLKLVVVGEGPARSDLERLAESMGLERSVVFAGLVAHDRLKAYYAIAEVFVFASKVESQGIVVLEAMQCGLPVVAIGKMGTREVMGGSNGGFMVDDDPDEFRGAVESLLDDPGLRERKRDEAVLHASKWTMRAQGRKMERLYQVVLRWKGLCS